MLDRLPFDILYTICEELDPFTLVHLASTCRNLRDLCSEQILAKKTLTRFARYALESQWTFQNDHGDWRQALLRFYRRRNAVAQGIPAAARDLGDAQDFLYFQGVLCHTTELGIHVMDLVQTKGKVTIPFDKLLESPDFLPCLKLLHYCDDILSILYIRPHSIQPVLLAIEISWKEVTWHHIAQIPLESSNRIFVRNSRDYLYYGVHMNIGDSSKKQWEIRGYSLRNEPFPPDARSPKDGASNLESIVISLKDFTGPDIGSTVAFRIHEGFFYAVTNKDDEDCKEVDWTSFYTALKFPLHNPAPCQETRKLNPNLYRRQHREGPIHGSWTFLELQPDETTNDLIIVEARQEWLDGKGRQTRTVYLRNIKFQEFEDDYDDELEGFREGVGPDGDLYSSLALPDSRYAKPQPRMLWQVHPEDSNRLASKDEKTERDGNESFDRLAERSAWSQRPFLRQNTKFQTYDLATNTIIDLVYDNYCCNVDLQPREACLRLRTASRQIDLRNNSLIYNSGKKRSKDWENMPSSPKAQTIPGFASGSHFPHEVLKYKYSPITLWPRSVSLDWATASTKESDATTDYTKRMHDILNPPLSSASCQYGGLLDVKAESDERTIVILIKNRPLTDRDFRDSGRLIVLSFDNEAQISKQQKPECQTLSILKSCQSSPPLVSPKTPTICSSKAFDVAHKPYVISEENAFFQKMLAPIEKIPLDLNDPEWKFHNFDI